MEELKKKAKAFFEKEEAKEEAKGVNTRSKKNIKPDSEK